jgi:hypothetical protein
LTARASCVTITGMRTLVLVVVGFASATAMAQPAPSEGGKLFEEGRELAKGGKFAEACDKFEKSYALDPGVGTELNMADCQEHLQHFATAWRMFDEAAQRLASEPARQKFARDRADAIAIRLGTVVVKVADANAAGTTVTIAGRVVKPAPEITEHVDPGLIAVKVTRADKPALEKSQSVAAGGTITIELGDGTGSSSGPSGPEHVGVEERRHSRVILSYGVAGVGAGVFLGGVIIGLVAKSKYSTATKNCMTDASGTLRCDQMHFDDAQSAGNLADVGTIVGSIGLAAVVGGAVLYLTAPKDFVVTPMASGQTAGVAISGKF